MKQNVSLIHILGSTTYERAYVRTYFWIWDFGILLILGATGHGCSAEGTDAAPRAHGTGALQASQTYVRTALIDFPFDRGGPFAWPASIK